MADPSEDYGYSAETEQMLAELEKALAADQQQRKAGFEATKVAARGMKDAQLSQELEAMQRQHSAAMQQPSPEYPNAGALQQAQMQSQQQMPAPASMAAGMAPGMGAGMAAAQAQPQQPNWQQMQAELYQ
jgi:hypothetical protein